jgi:5-methylcytosine-specific restriction endonuclease McrA
MSLDDLRALYQTSRWRRAAHAFLRLHPVCIRPGCGQRATVVDHIIPRSTARDEAELQRLTWDRSNWQQMCKPDHDAKTRRENGWDKPKRRPRVGVPASAVVRRDYTARAAV